MAECGNDRGKERQTIKGNQVTSYGQLDPTGGPWDLVPQNHST